MNWWQRFAKLTNKSLIYLVESYILFMVGLLFLRSSFSLQPFQLWIVFVLLSLSTLLDKKKLIPTYSLIVGLFLLGILYYSFSLIPWVTFFLILIWRFSVLEQKKEINIGIFTTHLFYYIGLSVFLILVKPFFVIPITANSILFSYFILLLSYIVFGVMQQVEKTALDRNLIKSLSILLGIIVLSIGAVFTFFYVIKKPLLFLYIIIRDVISAFLLFIAKIVSSLVMMIYANAPKERQNVVQELLQITPPDEEAQEIIPQVDHSNFAIYFERFLLFMFVLGLIFLVYKIIQRIQLNNHKNAPSAVKMAEERVGYQRKIQARRFISANVFRKLYQQWIVWLVRKRKLPVDSVNHSLTSSEVNEKIAASYPDISPEVRKITADYQRIRYGNEAASVSEKEFKTLIKYIKGQIKVQDKEKR